MSWLNELQQQSLPSEAQGDGIALESFTDSNEIGQNIDDVNHGSEPGGKEGTGNTVLTEAVSTFSQSPILDESSPHLTGQFHDEVDEAETEHKALGEIKTGIESLGGINQKVAKSLFARLPQAAIESLNPLGLEEPESQFTVVPTKVLYTEAVQAINDTQAHVTDELIEKTFERMIALKQAAESFDHLTLHATTHSALDIGREIAKIFLANVKDHIYLDKMAEDCMQIQPAFNDYFQAIVKQNAKYIHMVLGYDFTQDEGIVINSTISKWYLGLKECTCLDDALLKAENEEQDIPFNAFVKVFPTTLQEKTNILSETIALTKASISVPESIEAFRATIPHLDSQTVSMSELATLAKGIDSKAHKLEILQYLLGLMHYTAEGVLYLFDIMTGELEKQAIAAGVDTPLWIKQVRELLDTRKD